MNRIPKNKSPFKSISHTGLVYKRFPKFTRLFHKKRKNKEIERRVAQEGFILNGKANSFERLTAEP